MDLVHTQKKTVVDLNRLRWVAAFVVQLRGAFEELEGVELGDYMESWNLSRQEISDVCCHLELDTRKTIHVNCELIKYLKTLQPKKIWSGR